MAVRKTTRKTTTRKSTSTRKRTTKKVETTLEPKENLVIEPINEDIEEVKEPVSEDLEDVIDNEVTSEIPVQPVEKLTEPVKVEFEDKDVDSIVNLNLKKTTEESAIKKEVIPLSKNNNSNAEINKRKEKRVDLGILVVIAGLFILILTTYLSFSIDLNYKVTNTGVVIALVVELTGIIIVIANSFRRN